MTDQEEFRHHIDVGYAFRGESLLLGSSIFKGQVQYANHVRIPLRMMNRHGLIAGATGTGKTKTLQNLAEKLSEKGVPVLLMDVKGDLSGIGMPGQSNSKIEERHDKIGSPWISRKYPVELYALGEQNGVRLRATISEFGPVLLSKMLGLNETQSGIVSIAFKYCDDHGLPLLDIRDFRSVLQFISAEGKTEVEKHYGLVSLSSVGAILRKLLELESQGADLFFGEPSFDIQDLLRLDPQGKGCIHVVRLDDMQGKPALFSTFILCLLAEIYSEFGEMGDPDKPKLVCFVDEAHLLFREATPALLQQLETMVKLIRSKGVGIYFCTQNPSDIPPQILSQLGLKIQHALRAFTARDRMEIRRTAENYPLSTYYDTETLLTSLGIGEAMVTALNDKGIPTPLVHTLLTAPSSRMDILTDSEKLQILESSELYRKYQKSIDRESAWEILNGKLDQATTVKPDPEPDSTEPRKSVRERRPERSTFEKIATHSITRTIIREIARGLLGVLSRRRW